tara:strand:- start:248 stop:628 length:381 start_codon:yes stop_codon:yes gene_type:complete
LKIIRNTIITVWISLGLLVVNAEFVFAQIIESDIGYEPGSNETIQRVTSTFEVKRAVIGLLIIAAIAGVIFFFYWYKTGQWARERHAQEYGTNSKMRKRISRQTSRKQWEFVSQKQDKSTKPFRRN